VLESAEVGHPSRVPLCIQTHLSIEDNRAESHLGTMLIRQINQFDNRRMFDQPIVGADSLGNHDLFGSNRFDRSVGGKQRVRRFLICPRGRA
jgi:hypothetical protein